MRIDIIWESGGGTDEGVTKICDGQFREELSSDVLGHLEDSVYDPEDVIVFWYKDDQVKVDGESIFYSEEDDSKWGYYEYGQIIAGVAEDDEVLKVFTTEGEVFDNVHSFETSHMEGPTEGVAIETHEGKLEEYNGNILKVVLEE